MGEGYDFTSDWFSHFRPIWKQILESRPPSCILEIGSYEGRSACFVVDHCASARRIELHCVDTWAGGIDHDPATMGDVERRFDANIARAIAAAAHPVDYHKHRAPSHLALAGLVAAGRSGAFDLVYIDGSHQAPDVLSDAVLGFRLAKRGGLIIFDDYLWTMEGQGRQDAYNMPKPAIDAFVNIFQRKLTVLNAPLGQLYVMKIAD